MSSSWLKLSLTYFLPQRIAVDIFTIHKCESLFCLLVIKIACGNDKLIMCCVKKINFYVLFSHDTGCPLSLALKERADLSN